MSSQFFHLLAISAGIFGAAIAGHIFFHKMKKKPLVCPMKAHCDAVIHSDYSKTFGIHNETIGFVYYLAIILIHSLYFFSPASYDGSTYFLIFTMSLGAFLFSMYLIGVQFFALKQWCTWCVFSAFASTIIFISTLFSIDVSMVNVFSSNRDILLVLHIVGLIIGIGGALVTDVMFFRFLKDFKISEAESATLKKLSNAIWFAIILLIVSGFGLFYPESERLLQSGKFLTKMIAVLVLVLNGVMLNLLIAPRLVQISFDKEYSEKEKDLRHLKRLAFFSGAVSLSTWIFVFTLGAIRNIPWPFETIFSFYLILLALAYLGSRVAEKLMIRK